MKNILIISGRYLPGYKDGGPVRTIKNLIDNLGSEYNFTIMCKDRDHGDLKPYDGIKVNDLNRVDKAFVYYCGDGKFKSGDIKDLCKKNDLVYVCGPYNDYAIKALFLKKTGQIKIPFVLAPMGSFSKGALAIKSGKKNLFFKLCKILGLYKNIYFSVTSSVEETELKAVLGNNVKCFIAEDMPRGISVGLGTGVTCVAENTLVDDNDVHANSSGDALKVIFLSRICEKKNLTYAVEVLSQVKENILFHIYGVIEDKEYYDKCISMLNGLPSNISWKYMGEADSEKVPQIFSNYDVFLFPTMGENFGHVISEALSAGCIPVISNTTPWLDLEKWGCGFVIPLEYIEAFVESISYACSLSEADLYKKKQRAIEYFKKRFDDAIYNSGYKKMFDELLK